MSQTYIKRSLEPVLKKAADEVDKIDFILTVLFNISNGYDDTSGF